MTKLLWPVWVQHRDSQLSVPEQRLIHKVYKGNQCAMNLAFIRWSDVRVDLRDAAFRKWCPLGLGGRSNF